MTVSFQSAEGHTVLEGLTKEQVDEKFAQLTGQGYRAFAGTTLDDAAGPIKTAEAIPADTQELYFIAPLVGG